MLFVQQQRSATEKSAGVGHWKNYPPASALPPPHSPQPPSPPSPPLFSLLSYFLLFNFLSSKHKSTAALLNLLRRLTHTATAAHSHMLAWHTTHQCTNYMHTRLSAIPGTFLFFLTVLLSVAHCFSTLICKPKELVAWHTIKKVKYSKSANTLSMARNFKFQRESESLKRHGSNCLASTKEDKRKKISKEKKDLQCTPFALYSIWKQKPMKARPDLNILYLCFFITQMS